MRNILFLTIIGFSQANFLPDSIYSFQLSCLDTTSSSTTEVPATTTPTKTVFNFNLTCPTTSTVMPTTTIETSKSEQCGANRKTTSMSFQKSFVTGACLTYPFIGQSLTYRNQEDLAAQDYSKIMTFKAITYITREQYSTQIEDFLKLSPSLNVFVVQFDGTSRAVLLDAALQNSCSTDTSDCLDFKYEDVNSIFFTICWDSKNYSNGLYIETLFDQILL
ncbi:CUB domain-containing protein [Caenorhabditis elegans]|uniref:CUB domain-containing protein n=1 Tax=Caenorhabditis elegans TaxID=6239 RepID=Q95XY2_CAEEL|nr:CUB domain-containing protein [Caenorhabditis elegans]CCD72293.2 CUB domain-containing protein [Caenorhabditis elegans]